MNFFEQLSKRPHDADDEAVVSSHRQLLLAATGVLAIAGGVVLAAGLGASGRARMAAAPQPVEVSPLGAAAPFLDTGDILAGSGLSMLSTEPVSARLTAGQSMMTRGYRNAQGRHEFAIVTPEIVPAEGGTSVRMNLRVFSLDDAQLLLAGLETSQGGSAQRPGGSRIWSAEDVNQTLAALPPDIHRSIPAVTVEPGSSFSTSLGESSHALFFLEGKAVPAEDGGFDLETDLKCVAKNS